MLRRFHITVDFKALTEEGVKKLLDKFFNDYAFSEKLIHRLCAYDSVGFSEILRDSAHFSLAIHACRG